MNNQTYPKRLQARRNLRLKEALCLKKVGVLSFGQCSRHRLYLQDRGQKTTAIPYDIRQNTEKKGSNYGNLSLQVFEYLVVLINT